MKYLLCQYVDGPLTTISETSTLKNEKNHGKRVEAGVIKS